MNQSSTNQQTIIKSNIKQTKETKMKKIITEAKKQILESNMSKVEIIEKGGSLVQNKRLGFLKQNRPIAKANIINFLQVISNGDYDDAFPIITAEATELLVAKHELIDLGGNKITECNASDFLIVLDGQHRVTAFTKLNAVKGKEEQLTIPNVRIRDLQGKNVGEYLASINLAGHSWTAPDKLCISAITTENMLLDKVNEMIKDGFNATTAVLICVGKRLTASQIKKILSKKDTSMLPDEKEQATQLKRAEKFYTTCMKIQGMSVKILTKRYFIEGFNSYAKATSEDTAFEALNNLVLSDFEKIKESDDFVENLKLANLILSEAKSEVDNLTNPLNKIA